MKQIGLSVLLITLVYGINYLFIHAKITLVPAIIIGVISAFIVKN